MRTFEVQIVLQSVSKTERILHHIKVNYKIKLIPYNSNIPHQD